MREIEFRGKASNGKWVYGYYYVPVRNLHLIVERNELLKPMEYCVIPETIGQYTGLKDKNGVKIFEGDVVRVFTEAKTFNDGFDDYPEREYIRKVEITETSFGLLSVFGVFIMGSLCNPTVEVIGNIHDNPELLQKGENNVSNKKP